MSENQTTMAPQAEGQAPEFDAIVVGADAVSVCRRRGGVGPFRAICQDVAEKGYEGLVLTRH